MASISKTPTGKWRAQVYKKGLRASETFETKAEAKNWAAAKEAEFLQEKKTGPQKTLTQAIEKYISEVSVNKHGKRWEEARLAAFQRDFSGLCAKMLGDISTADMSVWRDTRLKTVTRGTVQREINLLSNVFCIARDEWRWMTDTPFRGMRLPGENPPREKLLRWREIKAICRYLGYVTGWPPLTKSAEIAYAFLIACRTSMRSKEVLQLSDATVDLANGVAIVEHKTQYITGRPRQIPLTQKAMRLMRKLSGRGAYFTVSEQSRDAMFRKAIKALMLGDLHFHDSRGLALTLFARKVDVLTLSRISGIKDIKLLSETYYRETTAEISSRLRNKK